jgi:hypothetical protein
VTILRETKILREKNHQSHLCSEIYNEEVRDLLSETGGEGPDLTITHTDADTVVNGQRVVRVTVRVSHKKPKYKPPFLNYNLLY